MVIPGIDTDEKEGLGGILNLGKRDIRYIESKDFINWTEAKLLGFDESLADLAGKEVIMKVRMRDADLYSIRFAYSE